jgi:hypothetical protein
MKYETNEKSNLFMEIKNLIGTCDCKKEKFILDAKNDIIISKDMNTTKRCEKDCCLMTKLTMYLITNDIDYNLLEDYSLKLNL